MKTTKIILSAILMMMALCIQAQTIQVMKDGKVVKEYAASEVKSVEYVIVPVFRNAETGEILNLKTTTISPIKGRPASDYLALMNKNESDKKLRITSNVPYEQWIEGLSGMELFLTSYNHDTYGENYTYIIGEGSSVIYIPSEIYKVVDETGKQVVGSTYINSGELNGEIWENYESYSFIVPSSICKLGLTVPFYAYTPIEKKSYHLCDKIGEGTLQQGIYWIDVTPGMSILLSLKQDNK